MAPPGGAVNRVCLRLRPIGTERTLSQAIIKVFWGVASRRVTFAGPSPLPDGARAPRTVQSLSPPSQPEQRLPVQATSLPLPGDWPFAVGPENRALARVVERLVQGATDPSAVSGLHPVLLAGPSGSGKTDIITRIAEAYRVSREPGAVITLTASDFRRALAEAARGQDAADFREQLASAELLVIDDLPRLAVSESAQHELCSVIDSQAERGGLLIGASTGPLAYCEGVSPRLRSRFNAGLMVEIAPLGVIARMAVLQSAARREGVALTSAAARLLAERLTPEPRKLIASARELSRQALRARASAISRSEAEAYANASPQNEPALADIIRIVARYYKVPVKLLASGVRRQRVVMARAVAIYLARQHTSLSYKRIGAGLGGRDHSTIMHNCGRIEESLTRDPRLAAAVAELSRLLSSHT